MVVYFLEKVIKNMLKTKVFKCTLDVIEKLRKQNSKFIKKVKEFLKKHYFKGIILSFIIGVLAGFPAAWWSVSYNFKIQEKKIDVEKIRVEPNIDINISQNQEELIVLIESLNIEGEKVENLHFAFAIPGTVHKTYGLYQDSFGGCKIKSFVKETGGGSFASSTDDEVFGMKEVLNEQLYSDPMKNFGGVTLSQMLDFQCSSISPGGNYQIKLIYRPSDKILEKQFLERHGSLKYFSFIPLDLYDYYQYDYFWNFNGKTQTKKDCLDLSDLNYIQLDNDRYVEFRKGFYDLFEIDVDTVEKIEAERSPCAKIENN